MCPVAPKAPCDLPVAAGKGSDPADGGRIFPAAIPVFALRPNGALVVVDGRIHSMGDVMCVFPANKDLAADVYTIDAGIAEAEAEVQNSMLMDASEALSALKKRYFGEKTDY